MDFVLACFISQKNQLTSLHLVQSISARFELRGETEALSMLQPLSLLSSLKPFTGNSMDCLRLYTAKVWIVIFASRPPESNSISHEISRSVPSSLLHMHRFGPLCFPHTYDPSYRLSPNYYAFARFRVVVFASRPIKVQSPVSPETCRPVPSLRYKLLSFHLSPHSYDPNYGLSADEAIAELEEDDAFEEVFVEEEVLDDELAEELSKKKRRAKKPAAPKPAAAAKPPAKKSKSTKADPMTGRGGEPPKSEALRLFTHVLPPEAKGKEKVDEESGPAEGKSFEEC